MDSVVSSCIKQREESKYPIIIYVFANISVTGTRTLSTQQLGTWTLHPKPFVATCIPINPYVPPYTPSKVDLRGFIGQGKV